MLESIFELIENEAEGRGQYIEKVEKAYDRYKETCVIHYPEWLYGPPKSKLFQVEVEDCPEFGETAELEFDSGRTAFLSIDMQQDFCGHDGYVDIWGATFHKHHERSTPSLTS
jgi:hypothetical protein